SEPVQPPPTRRQSPEGSSEHRERATDGAGRHLHPVPTHAGGGGSSTGREGLGPGREGSEGGRGVQSVTRADQRESHGGALHPHTARRMQGRCRCSSHILVGSKIRPSSRPRGTPLALSARIPRRECDEGREEVWARGIRVAARADLPRPPLPRKLWGASFLSPPPPPADPRPRTRAPPPPPPPAAPA